MSVPGLRRHSLLARFRHDVLDARHQRGGVVGDAVLDGPLHAAGMDLPALADLFDAGGAEHHLSSFQLAFLPPKSSAVINALDRCCDAVSLAIVVHGLLGRGEVRPIIVQDDITPD
jgi:hypothetical protein